MRAPRKPQTDPRARQISMDALARAKAFRKKKVNPYEPAGMPLHPPGVGHNSSMAMDEEPFNLGINAWAMQWANSAFTEGLTFLGYPYLAELAQRPEYRVISETIATEMTRNWIKISSKSDDDDTKADKIDKINDAMKRLCMQDVFRRLIEQDGFFGRSHLYIDTGDTENLQELVTDLGDGHNKVSKAKIAKNALQRLATVEAVWCYPTNYNSDNPLKTTWYNPTNWYVMGIQVHSSRLIRFVGREVPDLL